MGKADVDFDREGYAPVAERLRLFYAAYPAGRILTELVSRTPEDVVFKALVYRTPTDREPAATGWAAEREGDGEINRVACLENTETSAIGRALANLGFTAARQRPSAEEMAKASRVRARLASIPASDERALLIADLFAAIRRAARLGVRPARIARWQTLVASNPPSLHTLVDAEHRLRAWIASQTPIQPY